MTLLVDNYDSFTNNLCDYLAQLGQEVLIIKNDVYTIDEIAKLSFVNAARVAGWPNSSHVAPKG